jgi:hypothetical protein
VSVTEAQQLSLFHEYRFESSSELPHASHAALGVALIVLSWVPIALLIWALT